MINERRQWHYQAIALMRHNDEEILAEELEGVLTSHDVGRYGECPKCKNASEASLEPFPDDWPCMFWQHASDQIMRWLITRLDQHL